MFFWGVTQSTMVVFTEVSGETFSTMFKGQVFQGPRGCPETSATYYNSELRKIPEEGRSHLHREGSLKSLYSQNYEKFCLLSPRKLTELVSPYVTTLFAAVGC